MVTGAGSPIGLGRTMVLALVEAGARVAMVDVNEPALARNAEEARQVGGGGSVLPVVADVSQPAAAKSAQEAFVASAAGILEGIGVTANVLVPGGATNTNLLPPDSSRDRTRILQPHVMGPPVVWLASAASDGFNGRRIIAQHWDE